MKTYSFYHRETGRVHPTVVSTSMDDPPDAPTDHVVFEGRADHKRHRVDLTTGELVEDRELAAAHADLHRNSTIKAQIESLERQQPRAVREAILGDQAAVERLRALDDRIATLRDILNR